MRDAWRFPAGVSGEKKRSRLFGLAISDPGLGPQVNWRLSILDGDSVVLEVAFKNEKTPHNYIEKLIFLQ